MMEFATDLAFGLLGFGALCALVRIWRGPALADRVLGLDTLGTLGVGLIGVFAARSRVGLYADLGIALALVSFVSTMAFARFLLRRKE